jgi:hypothetical protein
MVEQLRFDGGADPVRLKGSDYTRRWRARNPEQARSKVARWRAANPEKANAASRRWQAANPDRVRATLRARIAKKKSQCDQIKLASGCVDCGPDDPEISDPRFLHFHHRDPTTKLFAIAKGVRVLGWARIETEIAKCDVLCEKHHLERHRKYS